MQKIKYTEQIPFNDNLKELLMINIDDKLNKDDEKDLVKIYGEIRISGEVRLEDKTETFSHPIDVDITLSKEQSSPVI